MRYTYYGCHLAHREGTCQNRVTARANTIEPLLLSRIQEELLKPQNVDVVMKRIANLLNEKGDAVKRAQLVKQRDQLQRKAERTAELLVTRRDSSPVLLAQLDKAEADVAVLNRQLKDIDSKPPTRARRITVQDVKKHLANAADLLNHDVPTAKAQLMKLGVSFTVYPVYWEGRTLVSSSRGPRELLGSEIRNP